MPPTATVRPEPNPFQDLVDALANRHGEVDLRLDRLTVKLPMLRDPVEVSGSLTISVHLRELSDKERAANIAREVRAFER